MDPRDVPQVDSDLVRKFLVYEDGGGVRREFFHVKDEKSLFEVPAIT